jgi:FimV-like protein
MKLFYACLPLLWLFMMADAAIAQATDSINQLTDTAVEKFESGDETEALEIFEEVLGKDPVNYEALWNTSLLYAREGYRLENEDDQREKYRQALDLAEKAIEHHPDKGHSYYVYSVAKGRMTELMRTRDRIRAAHEIRDSIEKASQLIPDYAPVWHLYGVWHSDVSNVGRAERMAARFISRGLPKASSDKAEEFLKKAIELDEGSILFRLDLARHYLQTGEQQQARQVLEEIVLMEPATKDDPEKIEEAREMLEALN